MFTLKNVAIALTLTVAALVAFVASRPTDFRIERSLAIPASADVVFAQVSDFHAWTAWSPWEGLDPAMKRQYEGVSGKTGSSFFWDGNDQVGSGRMSITRLEPSSFVEIKLEFFKPWPGVYTTQLALASEGDRTKVTWSMRGQNNFLMKAMSLFMDMDKMVGADYERGLQKLASVSSAIFARQTALDEANRAAVAPTNDLTTDQPAAAPPASPTP